MDKARIGNAKTDRRLRQILGFGALAFAAGQIIVADLAFYWYGGAEKWHLPPPAIIGWLSATVVQVVGIVAVIARYLFPDGGPAKEQEGH